MKIFYVLYTTLNIFAMALCEQLNEDDLRIIGGRNAKPGEIPYQLAYIGEKSKAYYLCGAAILDEHHFLTAAHCSEDKMDKLTIVAGSIRLGNISQPTGIVFPVDQVYTKNFSFETGENDIAIGRIKGKFVWSADVKPIQLRTELAPFAGDCVVSGWGMFGGKTTFPEILQVASLPIRDRKVCEEAFPDTTISKDKICAGKEKVRTCIGDSGGPFVCGGLLIAVVSQGSHCRRDDLPVVFTDVGYHAEWVQKTLQKSYADLEEPVKKSS